MKKICARIQPRKTESYVLVGYLLGQRKCSERRTPVGFVNEINAYKSEKEYYYWDKNILKSQPPSSRKTTRMIDR